MAVNLAGKGSACFESALDNGSSNAAQCVLSLRRIERFSGAKCTLVLLPRSTSECPLSWLCTREVYGERYFYRFLVETLQIIVKDALELESCVVSSSRHGISQWYSGSSKAAWSDTNLLPFA